MENWSCKWLGIKYFQLVVGLVADVIRSAEAAAVVVVAVFELIGDGVLVVITIAVFVVIGHCGQLVMINETLEMMCCGVM